MCSKTGLYEEVKKGGKEEEEREEAGALLARGRSAPRTDADGISQ